MNKIIKLSLLLMFSISLSFGRSDDARNVPSLPIQKSDFDSSLRIDKGDGLENQILDKKRSHKRRRKVRKPRKGIR
tara:strand:+ start:609 stop:836 length:228 start_codon:yes stop_codon:yes gene_type:complete